MLISKLVTFTNYCYSYIGSFFYINLILLK